MNRTVLWTVSIGMAFLGFSLLYARMGKIRFLSGILRRTREGMEASARQRLLADRFKLGQLERKNSLFVYLERQLHYSGLHIRFPKLSVEKWIAGNLCILAVIFGVVYAVKSIVWAIIVMGGCVLAEWLFLMVQKASMMHRVNDDILKFLDFCGNYSITSGEITGVFDQVSHYVDEPLQTVLNECYVEAQISGDAGLALLAMAEKVEHPKFKELVRNMEISLRYCADFKVLVAGSRRSIREYLRMREERKGMLREASVNMGLLLLMSILVMVSVDSLIEENIWNLLLFTIPGHIAMGIIGGIMVLFLNKMYQM